jgi:hypothetical protein
MTDRETAKAFLINCHLHRNGQTADAHPDKYFLAAMLAEQGKSPIVKDGQSRLPLNYAYHFDSVLVGNFIRELSIKQGVKHLPATIVDVGLHLSGDIDFVETSKGEKLYADYFIDCSGFRSLLTQQALKEPFVSFKDNLFNDSAIALPTQASAKPVAQTTATALNNGWAWHIPLKHRTGNGYVFSSEYCSFDQAEQELRSHLGLNDTDLNVRRINMKVGRCQNTWVKNCVAIGLSQGFIEPLEATALHIVQETVQNFIGAFSAGGFTDQHREQFNSVINARIDGIRDYIVCHYQVTNREDTPYWKDNKANTQRSASLSAILEVWNKGGDITQEINRQQIGHYYPSVSWHCLLSGYEVYNTLPSADEWLKAEQNKALNKHLNKLSALFTPHEAALEYDF